MTSSFHPHPLLRNPHVQGLISRLPGRRRKIMLAAAPMLQHNRSVLLHAGEAMLSGQYAAQANASAPLVILLHGWEGSTESLYLLATASVLFAQGCSVLRLNLRDHGDSHHLNKDLFHSCRDQEVADAVQDACARWPTASVFLAGFSLGGNFALRLGTLLPATLPIREIIAVCPVLDPARTLQALEQGPWFYRQYFLRKWRQSLQRKASVFPELAARLDSGAQKTLTAMTAHFVSQHTELPSLSHYLSGYSLTGSRLAGLLFPAHIVLAADDPVIPAADITALSRSAKLSWMVSPHGGHCGFIDNFRYEGWSERYIAARIKAALSGDHSLHFVHPPETR